MRLSDTNGEAVDLVPNIAIDVELRREHQPCLQKRRLGGAWFDHICHRRCGFEEVIDGKNLVVEEKQIGVITCRSLNLANGLN